MCRIFFTFLIFLFAQKVFGQGINFQGVARSANGTILASQNISLRLSLIPKSVNSTPEYVEIRTVLTNAQGIFSIVIGEPGTITTIGSFSNVNWKEPLKFLKVEMDPNAGLNFITMGVTQLQNVPFSYYSYGIDASNVNGVLPIKSGGTGVSTLDSLKISLKIPNYDTSSLSSRIDLKLNKSDTASLSNRINSIRTLDTTSLSTRIDNKLNKSDTSSLSNRINAVRTVDTTYLSSRIDLKLNKSDTSSLLQKKDTINLSNRINGKLDINNPLFPDDITINGLTIGRGNLSGEYNTAIGRSALLNNQENNNTAIGYGTLGSNLRGLSNTAIGTSSLASNYGGSANTSSGAFSLQKNYNGSYNTAIGLMSLQNNYNGNNNTALGTFALQNNTGGNSNTAVGHVSLYSNKGNENTSVGSWALTNNVSGNGNSGIGAYALFSNTSGNNNTAIGFNSLNSNEAGYNNTAIGNLPLNNNVAGYNNTAIGNLALSNNVDGYNNTAIGFGANVSSGNLTNTTAIGSGALVSASNTIQLGNSSVNDVITSGKITAKSFISTQVHNIGETFGGGIIFYVTPNGLHGLIAETQDQSNSSTWFDAQNIISDNSSHSVEGANYSDWRLPTKFELKLMYDKKDVIGGFIIDNNVYHYYWSSTESNSINAWSYPFGTQVVYTYGVDKANPFCVRSIRSF
jgi:trimeric autotransporter adhesin